MDETPRKSTQFAFAMAAHVDHTQISHGRNFYNHECVVRNVQDACDGFRHAEF